jgi:hypothetical protein
MGDKAQARRTRPASKTPRGTQPEPTEALAAVRELAPFRSLLHALTGRSPYDFSVRVAILQAVVESRHPIFSSQDLDERLSWLTGKTRPAALRALQQGGWLESHPTAGLVLTAAGQRVFVALQLLRHADRGEELTSDEVTSLLRRKSLGELASAGRDALLPAFIPLPLLSTDAVVQVAESRILRSRGRTDRWG